MYGQISKINGSNVVVKLNDEIDLNKLNKLSNGNVPSVELLIDDGRSISIDQRKKIFALIGDMSNFIGYFRYECEAILKSEFIRQMKHPRNFHFTRQDCSMQLANEFLTFEIGYLIDHNIPFKTQVFDEIHSSYALMHECLLKRICCVCGKPHADINHVDTVGRGFNRNRINHVGRRVIPLCRTCHQKYHQIGALTFMKMNQVKPIKLTENDVIKLNMESQKQVDFYRRNERGSYKI